MNRQFFLYRIKVITEEMIITKADIDFETNPDKRERAEILENELRELLK